MCHGPNGLQNITAFWCYDDSILSKNIFRTGCTFSNEDLDFLCSCSVTCFSGSLKSNSCALALPGYIFSLER
ncbi:hypothetical protein XELAEV_18018340mg [Xenopus laevis]|uniref:Uncharacterized protein n=1 Tax=Xenopus laevis TaxID=8355 RepID=A0A974DF41_XENLA|nr:hypothetical protein XELAEV_18018340mg [Xenopus laevis]